MLPCGVKHSTNKLVVGVVCLTFNPCDRFSLQNAIYFLFCLLPFLKIDIKYISYKYDITPPPTPPPTGCMCKKIGPVQALVLSASNTLACSSVLQWNIPSDRVWVGLKGCFFFFKMCVNTSKQAVLHKVFKCFLILPCLLANLSGVRWGGVYRLVV